jgi:hypothetical protein
MGKPARRISMPLDGMSTGCGVLARYLYSRPPRDGLGARTPSGAPLLPDATPSGGLRAAVLHRRSFWTDAPEVRHPPADPDGNSSVQVSICLTGRAVMWFGEMGRRGKGRKRIERKTVPVRVLTNLSSSRWTHRNAGTLDAVPHDGTLVNRVMEHEVLVQGSKYNMI